MGALLHFPRRRHSKLTAPGLQVSRLAEQNAALQEEVRQLQAARPSSPGSPDTATLQAVNAR